jgi:hypothetical protein
MSDANLICAPKYKPGVQLSHDTPSKMIRVYNGLDTNENYDIKLEEIRFNCHSSFPHTPYT